MRKHWLIGGLAGALALTGLAFVRVQDAQVAANAESPEAYASGQPIAVPHNQHAGSEPGQEPRGWSARIDPRWGKNNPGGIFNLGHPEGPTYGRGDSGEAWPLSEDVVLFSGRPAKSGRNVIQMIDRGGRRIVLFAEDDICLHSPMLVKPRTRPPVIRNCVDRKARTGRFLVQDVYRGLSGVRRGDVKWLRVLEETSRTSERTDGKNPFNQTFLEIGRAHV